ncbi:MAG: hypothetical protein WCK71_01040 [bacterium]
MSKRKKHKKSKSSRKSNVVKNTTIAAKPNKATDLSTSSLLTAQLKTKIEANEPIPKEPKNKTNKIVMADVTYSLVLLATIIAVFAVLMLLMSNRAISDSFYGIIKIKI